MYVNTNSRAHYGQLILSKTTDFSQVCSNHCPRGKLAESLYSLINDSRKVSGLIKDSIDALVYQSPRILTELFQHNLINVSYLTACYLYQVMMKLHFLNDVANDAESTQK